VLRHSGVVFSFTSAATTAATSVKSKTTNNALHHQVLNQITQMLYFYWLFHSDCLLEDEAKPNECESISSVTTPNANRYPYRTYL